MNDWIAVFRSGTHTDSSGNTRTWSDADLDTIVSSYNPAAHEAPAVIGHPKDNAPAWGWVEGLKREGSTLLARFKDVAPEFQDMLRAGRYRKRSISLYPDMSLRHVGFLGAQPPAVKGLPDFAFSSSEFSEIETDFTGGKNMSFLEKLKAFMRAEGMDTTASFSEDTVKAMIQAESARMQNEFAQREASFTAEAEKSRAEFAEREAAIAAKEAEIAQRARAERSRSIAEFCEAAVKAGRLLPAQAKLGMGLQTFMENVAALDEPVSFGEGEEAATQTMFEFMQAFVSAMPKQVEFAAVAGSENIPGGSASEKLSTLTLQKMEGGKMGYAQAFAEVQKEYPGLAAEYAAEIHG